MMQLRKSLNNDSFEKVCTKQKSPSFDDTEYNRTILEYFVSQKWISSYSVSTNNKLRAYPKRKTS